MRENPGTKVRLTTSITWRHIWDHQQQHKVGEQDGDAQWNFLSRFHWQDKH